MQGQMLRKKILAKKKIEKKKFMQKQSPVVTFIQYNNKKKLASVYKSSSHSENFWSLTPGPLLLTIKI